MNRLSILLAVLLVGVQVLAQNRFSADSEEITYIGRVVRADGNVTADWSGTTAIVSFQGKALTLHYDEAKLDYIKPD